MSDEDDMAVVGLLSCALQSQVHDAAATVQLVSRHCSIHMQ